MERFRLGAIAVDCLTFAQALDAVEGLVGRGGRVFTPNVDHVVRAASDARLREADGAADLSLGDGMPLVWASRLLGPPLPERVAGSDLVLPLMERAARRGWRVYLLGGGPGTATQSLTLQAWIDWNTLNLGRSAAVAYILLIVVTIVATLYVSYVRRRVTAYT